MFDIKQNAVCIVHAFIDTVTIRDAAVDATMGNGHDTLFLAKKITGSAKVYSFDIQKRAIQKTEELLNANGLLNAVELIEDDHQNIDKYITSGIDAAMFNLGYLPNGDHSIITRPRSTTNALNKILQLLKVGGKVSIIVYVGHEGGMDELNAVESFLTELETKSFCVVNINHINRSLTPVIFLIERISSDEIKTSA